MCLPCTCNFRLVLCICTKNLPLLGLDACKCHFLDTFIATWILLEYDASTVNIILITNYKKLCMHFLVEIMCAGWRSEDVPAFLFDNM